MKITHHLNRRLILRRFVVVALTLALVAFAVVVVVVVVVAAAAAAVAVAVAVFTSVFLLQTIKWTGGVC